MMMNSRRSIAFGCIGLFFALWTIWCLWRGEINTRGRPTIRAEDPYNFFVRIFYYALLSFLFLGAAAFFLLHPQTALIPTTQPGLDE
jgi:hypothetical protein